MRILSMKPGHDGAIASITDGLLDYAIEAEKDSFERYTPVTPSAVLDSLALSTEVPDVVCLSGWVKGWHSVEPPLGSGYYGWSEDVVQVRPTSIFGRPAQLYSSTHERSHLLSAYAMSPFPQGQPCYALLWEGNIGAFYELDEQVRVTRLEYVLEDPGNKYSHLFAIADPTFPSQRGAFRFENAGKLMALAAYGERGPEDDDERAIVDFLLSRRSVLLSTPKDDFAWSKFHNIGVESTEFKNLAAKFSDRVFTTFLDAVRPLVTERRPLLVTGGCGLNCDWNSRWLDTGLFEDVFVPPVTNDTGSAIGTAADAQLHFTGNAKIEWSVYAGTEFRLDDAELGGFTVHELRVDEVARLLRDGGVLGWVQGRYEMGPRALGNRSILAAPFEAGTRDRLNSIKQRDSYRPIAPVCLAEEAERLFGSPRESPYMLFFQEVRSPALAAVTHVDGSARIQTVNRGQNPLLHELLSAFKDLTGYGVLANTSLNFKGRGFINSLSDLARYAEEHDLDGFVVGDRTYLRRRAGGAGPPARR